jgi:hypothetical protein
MNLHTLSWSQAKKLRSRFQQHVALQHNMAEFCKKWQQRGRKYFYEKLGEKPYDIL